jgi:hypothetical protein
MVMPQLLKIAWPFDLAHDVQKAVQPAPDPSPSEAARAARGGNYFSGLLNLFRIF